MAESDEVVSKGDFAELCGVSAGRVTQWIAEGKISGGAIVGEGRTAKIRVAAAQRQINLRRDVGQALGNGITTKLKLSSGKAARPPEILGDEDHEDHFGDGTDDVDRKLKRAKLEAVERANRMAALEEATKTGLYTDTAECRAEMGGIAGQIIRAFEGALPSLSTAIAAHFKLEDREVKHFVTEQFRRIREQAAVEAQDAAEALPELLEPLPA